MSDAQSLFLALSTEEVSRFISPPPTSVQGFERFIAWTHQQRAAGHHVCFGVVPRGLDAAVGLFQVRSLEGDFGVSEWGFALASEHWGSGAFVDGAQLRDRAQLGQAVEDATSIYVMQALSGG